MAQAVAKPGKVSIGHPGFSGYVGTWVVQMKKLYGWDYFKKLEQNKPRIGRSINDTVTMLNAGERIVAGTYQAIRGLTDGALVRQLQEPAVTPAINKTG